MKDKDYKARLLYVLTKHVGKTRSISMAELYKELFGEVPKNKINQARIIRELVTELRKEGVPICSDTDREGGGYYLAAAGGELENYCMRLRIRALKILQMEANLRKKTLPELLGQIALAMGSRIDLIDLKVGGTTDE
jgi:hypothetical protein